jgi:glycine/D-amino acid oxidase-like deaminating enzyme
MAKDGSPFVGPARGLRTLVATGFGPVGFVFAPLMARLLANRSTAAEVNWLRRHGRGAQRPVDFAGALG